jgi:hypothetical protein
MANVSKIFRYSMEEIIINNNKEWPLDSLMPLERVSTLNI